jgi:hypothetical protein
MDEEIKQKKIKSVIIDAELKEWEEWGNRWFGGQDGQTDDTYRKEDLKKRN